MLIKNSNFKKIKIKIIIKMKKFKILFSDKFDIFDIFLFLKVYLYILKSNIIL